MGKPARWLACVVVAAVLVVGAAQGKEIEVPVVNAADFSAPVDNLYFPMSHGLTYRYLADEEDGLVRTEVTQTFGIKVIQGVSCTIVHDTEEIWVEDLAIWVTLEDTFDWYAWDNWGNVWYFGEDTLEYIYDDDWNLIDTSTEGSWEAGQAGATAGILMLADPKSGISYNQEFSEEIAEDKGKVLRLNATVSVEYGDFEDCVVTKDYSNIEPGAIEQKFFAPGVGLVLVREHSGKLLVVELTEIF